MATSIPSSPARAERPPVVAGALRFADACLYLGGIAPITLRRLVKRNLIKPNRALRHLIFSKAELDRFLVEN